MNEQIETKKLSIEDCKAIIKKYPLFYLLNNEDVTELARLMKEIRVAPGVLLTKEGDIVDSVFLIVSGEAKVSRTVTTTSKTSTMDIAVLKAGDAIGLAGTGFFAERGVRTATVSAMTPMVLLGIDIVSFQQFLQKPGVSYRSLKNTSDKILLMNFIEQSHLFKDYSSEQIQELAKIVEKVHLKEGDLIYDEDDHADQFYFIVNGKISLTKTNENKKVKITELYEPFHIFGEEEFVKKLPRKAYARAETDCELFILNHRILAKAEEHHALSQKPLNQFINKIKALWNKE